MRVHRAAGEKTSCNILGKMTLCCYEYTKKEGKSPENFMLMTIVDLFGKIGDKLKKSRLYCKKEENGEKNDNLSCKSG